MRRWAAPRRDAGAEEACGRGGDYMVCWLALFLFLFFTADGLFDVELKGSLDRQERRERS